MLRAKTPEEVAEIMHEFIEGSKPIFGDALRKVVLYGSYARGDYDAESDIDVMLLIDKDDEELRRDIDKIISLETDIGLKHDVFISPLLQSNEKFQRYLSVLPFYQAVEREGVVIYE